MAKKDSIEHHVLGVLVGAKAEILNIDRKNHVKIRYKYNGQSRLIVFPATESDHRARKNAVAFCKRQLREIDRA